MTLSLQDCVCIFLSWALMLMYSAAEHDYFIQPGNLNWSGARNHCQVCFKDLVTLTPGNTQGIASNLTSDSWVGLRKNFYPSSNSTSNSNRSWTRWANGDPLAFQNWYPGWPVFKSPFPKRDCCSCSCTCPAVTTPRTTSFTRYTEFTTPDVTSFSGFQDDTTENTVNVINSTDVTGHTTDVTGHRTNVTEQPVTAVTGHGETVSECVRSPMLMPDVPDPDENYIEDSCVAMLSFGAWIEKNCSELLPFICYEDHFVCKADVDNVTSSTADLTWPAGPGAISHYRMEVRGVGKNQTEIFFNFAYNLSGLMPGTRYTVQVFPVKCGRDLNSQEVFFNTIPHKVENLTVTKVTETSVFLSWNKPPGNAEFYLISEGQGEENKSETEGKEVSGLTPGSPYTFIVLSGIGSRRSEASNITVYTKPGKVTNLSVSNNTNSSLILSWVSPEGNVTDFCVLAMNDSNDELFTANVTPNASQTRYELYIPKLPVGTKITLTVTARANNTLGDNVTIVNYTAPGPISGLKLEVTSDSLTATWKPPASNYTHFFVQLLLNGHEESGTEHPQELKAHFKDLKNAANYTVVVYSIMHHLRGPLVQDYIFTKPSPPTDANATSNKTHITFQWKAPVNTGKAKYLVQLISNFWGQNRTDTVDNDTSYTFDNLKSGSKYELQVQTVAGEERSNPLNTSCFTEPELREISLSMLCSSSKLLLCDKGEAKDKVFDELEKRLKEKLGDNVLWSLTKQENTAE
ncbi:receptor-type tyrosine-protein phosphatase H [Seriola aureovittata]|uniref:receptor-type tyrosine-protein phosphatase H n=1 Tax=Seriola aureovittata TaxID=2871759 RepID=UPI0024BE5E73|nr:receptor-type tyrosine-protein phosphatase H [Seriola aureovittata]